MFSCRLAAAAVLMLGACGGGSVQKALDALVAPGFGQLVIALGSLLILILLARFLYRRGIFLRV